MPTVQSLTESASELPPDQRLTLAHRILETVEPSPSPEIAAAWDAEIVERIQNYDAGTTRSRPASEVFEAIDRKLEE
jgi:putative addiction module component (TIGR02574 family)